MPHPIRRRHLLALASGSLAFTLGLALPAQAQPLPFPSKPITLIVPFPAGGATDVQARALAQAASKTLKQTIVIANNAGVAGTLGPATMARTAPADGYTLSIIPASLFRIPYIQKVNYDALTDFSYIIGLTSYSYAFTVPADSPFKTLPDMLAAAKADPGKVSFGAIGIGSSGHIALMRVARQAGFKPNYVPFKGAAEVIQAVLGGHVQVMNEAGWGAMAEAGKLRVLATMEAQRSPRFPNAPTLKELGYDVVVQSMVGIAGPKGMDPAIVKLLHDAFRQAADDPEFQRQLALQNQPFLPMTTEEYRRYVVEQSASDKRFVEELGFKLTE